VLQRVAYRLTDTIIQLLSAHVPKDRDEYL
jgi:hypothetical protein